MILLAFLLSCYFGHAPKGNIMAATHTRKAMTHEIHSPTSDKIEDTGISLVISLDLSGCFRFFHLPSPLRGPRLRDHSSNVFNTDNRRDRHAPFRVVDARENRRSCVVDPHEATSVRRNVNGSYVVFFLCLVNNFAQSSLSMGDPKV